MGRITKYIVRLLLIVAVMPWASCMGLIDLNDNPVCDYTVRLRYDYNQENTTRENMIDYHVRTLEEFIFDNNGVLVDVRSVTRDVCDGTWHSDIDLPPGKYSVIAIGNRDTRSRIWDEATDAAPVKGETLRGNMRMELDNAQILTGDTRGPSEPLYHGYRTFTVNPTGTSHVRVDMVHSHLIIRFRATWKNGAVPAERTNYYAILETIPSQYALMPEHYYPKGSMQCVSHAPATCDHYESWSEAVIHHIAEICCLGRNPLHHRYDTYITNDNEMWGQFTSYRIKNETAVRLQFWHWDEGTQTASDLLDNGIDLRDYLVNFRKINLDHTLKQEYYLDIVIDGRKAAIMPLQVADWEEGGTIGGS